MTATAEAPTRADGPIKGRVTCSRCQTPDVAIDRAGSLFQHTVTPWDGRTPSPPPVCVGSGKRPRAVAGTGK